jgi:hypothetical protein
MAITRDEARRLASLLPSGLSCDNARERLLVVAEILRTLTDADHALSNADIRSIISAAFGDEAAPAENTLAADIRAIAHAGALGLEVSVGPAGVRACRTSPSPSKVRLLLNAVQAARFLTYEQAADLQGDLLGLVSRHEEESLTGEVFVERRVRSAQVEVFDTLDVVARAMKRGKKIEFTYVYMDFEGRPMSGLRFGEPLGRPPRKCPRSRVDCAPFFPASERMRESSSLVSLGFFMADIIPHRMGFCLLAQ